MKKFFLFLAVLAGAYALLLFKPELYFGKSADYKCFTVRAHGETPAGFEASLDAAYEKIAAAELFKPEMKFEVIVPATRGEFSFFTPFQEGEFSRVNPFTGTIFLAAADFKAGEAHTEPGSRQFRKLSSEISAAAAREMARRLFRPLSYLFRSDWEIHGYSAHVSGLTGDYSPSDACTSADTPDLRDYKYGLMLELTMKEENVGFEDLLNRNVSEESAETRVKKMYCGG